jgi:hypothetical protein
VDETTLEGSITATVDNAAAISSVTLSGTLKSSLGTVAVNGTLQVRQLKHTESADQNVRLQTVKEWAHVQSGGIALWSHLAIDRLRCDTDLCMVKDAFGNARV